MKLSNFVILQTFIIPKLSLIKRFTSIFDLTNAHDDVHLFTFLPISFSVKKSLNRCSFIFLCDFRLVSFPPTLQLWAPQPSSKIEKVQEGQRHRSLTRVLFFLHLSLVAHCPIIPRFNTAMLCSFSCLILVQCSSPLYWYNVPFLLGILFLF
jgi:hypothetical protein